MRRLAEVTLTGGLTDGMRSLSRSYWTSDVLKSTVPGLVLGAIAVICMCGLIIWTTMAFCRCWLVSKRRRKGIDGDLSMADPFRNDDRVAMMAPEVRAVSHSTCSCTASLASNRCLLLTRYFCRKYTQSGDVFGSLLEPRKGTGSDESFEEGPPSEVDDGIFRETCR